MEREKHTFLCMLRSIAQEVLQESAVTACDSAGHQKNRSKTALHHWDLHPTAALGAPQHVHP